MKCKHNKWLTRAMGTRVHTPFPFLSLSHFPPLLKGASAVPPDPPMGKTFFRAKQRVLVLENSQPVHQARQRQYQRQLPLVTLYGIRPVSIILTINIHFDLQKQESTVGAEYPKEGSYWKNSVVSAQQLSTMLPSF